jgi:antitoxin component HigA of HigAB toxin-antitoxin module
MKGYKMDIRPIHNRRDHKAALTEIERHWDAPAGSPQADRLEVLALLVRSYLPADLARRIRYDAAQQVVYTPPR